MMKCKWAGDAADEYCKSCDGIKMMVDGLEKSCSECAGYEEGTEEVKEVSDIDMNPPVEDEVPFEEEKPVKTAKKPAKVKETNKSTDKTEKPVKTDSSEVKKVSEEKHQEEEKSFATGVMVTSLRYTSSATVKKGDNYYKFTAEEEWSVALAKESEIQDVREKLWAKLNSEVDKQIEDLVQ